MTHKYFYRVLSFVLVLMLVLAGALDMGLTAFAETDMVLAANTATPGTIDSEEPEASNTDESELNEPQLQIDMLNAEAGVITSAASVVDGYIVFPDSNFKSALLALGIGSNGEITPAQAAQVTMLDVTYKSISSLEGIEYFTALTRLECYGNQLVTLDVSQNIVLTHLNCSYNQLTTLDVSENTVLINLYCGGNQLTTLDVSNNTALYELICSTNKLTSLDVSENTALINLSCQYNLLTTLDVSKNTVLEVLFCFNNELTSLDVSKNTALINLGCYVNQLTTLDVSKNIALTYLSCDENQLTSLDVSKNTALKALRCRYNELTILDVSKNTSLENLDCLSNQLTTLDVSENTVLTTFHCSNNQLTTLDISKNTVLTWLHCSNNLLTTLDISQNLTLDMLRCDRNNMTSKDDVIRLHDPNVFEFDWQNVQIQTHTVTFKDWNGTTLKTETVTSGQAATAPSNPTRAGFTFTGWDTTFNNVTCNLTVTAQYKIKYVDSDIIENILDDAKNNAIPEDILNNLKDLDISELKNAVQSDKNIANTIKELEEIYKASTNITVQTTVAPNTHGNLDASKIHVVGAAFNASAGQTISLNFTKPANDVLVDNIKYKNCYQFDIDLVGVNDSSRLDVPVLITMPIPTGINPAEFRILHYHNDGSYEVIVPTINSNGTSTFAVTHFSVFAFVNEVNVVASMNSTRSKSSSDIVNNRQTSLPIAWNVIATELTKLTQSAVREAKGRGVNTASIRLRNANSVSLAALQAMAKSSGKMPINLYADTTLNDTIDVRIIIDPSKSTKELLLYGSTSSTMARCIESIFEKKFSNKIAVIGFSQQGTWGQSVEIAAKVNLTGMDTKNLCFYSYNSGTKTYNRIEKPLYWIDRNEYLHFTTELAGDIIISDGVLQKK